MTRTTRTPTTLDDLRMPDTFSVTSWDGLHFSGLVQEAAKHLLPLAAVVTRPEPLWVTAVIGHNDAEVRERGLPEYQQVYGPVREIYQGDLVFMDGARVPLESLLAFGF